MTEFPVFDAHFHVIDPRFPLVPNLGFLPDRYTVNDYRERLADYDLRGGAVISASFQAFDQDYLVDALSRLGPGFVGVTQLPATVSDEELDELDEIGVRGIRFNVKRGGSEGLDRLDSMARRVHERLGWHAELYADAAELSDWLDILAALPAVSIDHLGLSAAGLPTLLSLAEKGVRVKASGFGRADFDVAATLKDLHCANPEALMFGTDLPSTRAAQPYSDRHVEILLDALGDTAATQVLFDNAMRFYRMPDRQG